MQNKDEQQFKKSSPNKMINRQLMFKGNEEFVDSNLNGKKYFRKLSKNNFENFTTQPVLRNSSPQRLDRKYQVRSEFIPHRKSILSKQEGKYKYQDKKSVNSIFKKRVNSQSKGSNKKLSFLLQQSQNTSQFKISFAKKIIEQLKKQTQNIKKNSKHYSSQKIGSQSMQWRSKKISSKQKQIETSVQKLKPSLSINEVRLSSSSLGKKTSLSIKKLNTSSNQSKINFIEKSSKSKINSLQQKIAMQLNQNQTQYLNNALKKSSQPLNTYLQYILNPVHYHTVNLSENIKPKQKVRYQFKFDFLLQYLQIKQKETLLLHIDINSLKLIQSVHLCLIDIFNQYVNTLNSRKSILKINLLNMISITKNNKNEDTPIILNFQIIKEYSIVYFQTYSKIKIQFILCQMFFKNTKKKLIRYFIYQRLIFYFLIQCCLKQKIFQEVLTIQQIINLLQKCEEILVTITNMFFCDSHSNNNKQMTSNLDNNSLIDTFKILRLTRQLDKRLPQLKQTFQSIKQKINKNQSSFYYFDQVLNVFIELQRTIDKDENFDLTKLFKIQLYYNWTHLMIPPLFFVPPSSSKPFTLILDLDQTLIFYNEQTRILKYRPYMDRFLNLMQKYFQLIIFSSQSKQRTDIIVKQIQRDEQIFAYRLYKSHMVFQEGSLRKNIGYIGRNLAKVIFVDDQQKNTSWLPMNSFQIKPFTGDKQDKELLNLGDWLSSLLQQTPVDIRGKLKKPSAILDQITQIDEASSTIQRSIQYE